MLPPIFPMQYNHSLLIFLAIQTIPNLAYPKPNILLVYADDLGWGHLGCYGGDFYRTPNLDKLAAEGMRFTQAYAPAPICSASRASLLTGNSTARNGLEFVVKDKPGSQSVHAPLLAPPYKIDLETQKTTIPEVLARGGYQTAFYGKWHLNAHYKGYLGWSPTHGPKSQGFVTATEEFGSHPYSYWGKGPEARSFLPLPDGAFLEDGMISNAVHFLENCGGQPFFLMVSHFFVHDPNHTRIQWLYREYLEKLPECTPRREELARFGAMVTTLDHHVGQVLEALAKSGRAENTLVVFTSDNGGHPNYAGNAPLRGSKWNLYEGGIRVPFIVRWPGKVPAGTVSDIPVWSPDLMPTFAALAGVDTPTAKDGTNILPILLDPNHCPPERKMFWHFPYYHPERGFTGAPEKIGVNDGLTSKTRPHSAIRSGDWKLIHFYEDGREELYNLSEDLSETQDLAKRHPELARRLDGELKRYLEDVHARFPVPNPDYSKR